MSRSLQTAVLDVLLEHDARDPDVAAEKILAAVAATGPGGCPECGLPQPGPHRGTCSKSVMRGGS